MICDRTMGNFDNIIRNRFHRNHCRNNLFRIFKMATYRWKVNNSDGIIHNPACYKIICSDERDDVIDIFSSVHHEIAKNLSTINYSTNEWRLFYESLIFLYDVESFLYQKDVRDKGDEMYKRRIEVMVNAIDLAEMKFHEAQSKLPDLKDSKL